MSIAPTPAEFLDKVRQLKSQGRSERDIAVELGLTISLLRTTVAISKQELRKESQDMGTLPPAPFPIIDIHDKNPNKYIDKARHLVLEHYNINFLGVGEELHISEVYVVWFSKVLKNWKALVATEVANDGLYFEVTYNGDKKETYIDTYKKVGNLVITDQGHAEAEHKAKYAS